MIFDLPFWYHFAVIRFTHFSLTSNKLSLLMKILVTYTLNIAFHISLNFQFFSFDEHYCKVLSRHANACATCGWIRFFSALYCKVFIVYFEFTRMHYGLQWLCELQNLLARNCSFLRNCWKFSMELRRLWVAQMLNFT